MIRTSYWLALSCLLFLTTGCASTPEPKAETIYVGSPEVLTRERLVNDRLRQEEWLEEQLEASEEAEFARQGFTDIRSFFGLSMRAEVEADPNVLAIYDAKSAAALADIQRQEEDAALDSKINRIQKLKEIRQLRRELRLEALEKTATSDDGTGGDDDGGGGGGGDDNGGGDGNGDGDDDGNEEEEQEEPPGLSGDLPGFLDRLDRSRKLLAAGQPQESRAKVSPIEDFRDRLALREEIRQELLENALDDRHDLRGNTLYRMSVDVTVLPPEGLDAWAVVDFCVDGWRSQAICPASQSGEGPQGGPKDDDWNALHQRWLDHLERELNFLFQIRRLQARGCARPCGAGQVEEDESNCEPVPVCRLSQQDLLDLTVSAIHQQTCVPEDQTVYFIQGNGRDWSEIRRKLSSEFGSPTEDEVRVQKIVGRPEDRPGLDSSFRGLVDACMAARPECESRQQAIDFLLGLQLRSEMLETWGLKDYLNIANLNCGSPRVEIEEPTSEQRTKFKERLEETERVYAHSATPKESAQRISAVAARSTSFQAALGLGMLLGVAKVDSAAELIQESQALLEDVSRPPLVVGFTQTTQSAGFPVGYSQAAQAGWILGPKFEIETKSRGLLGGEQPYAAFSHLPVQNSLSANVSLPSWWESARVTTRTRWVGKDGKVISELATPVSHRIALPGRLQDITSTLARSREPIVFGYQTFDVTHGQEARLLIDGWNLWRSSRVTLGGQISDRITVLPNMGGVVATFDEVSEPLAPGGKLRKDVPVYIWTSEGYRLAGQANIHPGKKKPPAKLALELNPPRLVAGQPVKLKIVSSDLPKQRNDLDIHLRPWVGDSYGEPVVLEEVELSEADRTLTAALPDEDLGEPGTEVRVELEITKKDRGDIQTVAAEGLAIYFGSESMKMSVRSGDKTTDPIRLTTPPRMARAFPKFDETAEVELEVVGKGFSYELKSQEWKKGSSGAFTLESQLELKGQIPSNLNAGTELELKLQFTKEPLSKLLKFDSVKLEYAPAP